MDRVLHVFALGLIFLGLWGVVEFATGLYEAKIHLLLRLLLLPAGIGLMWRREIWRKFTLGVIALFAVLLCVISIAYFFSINHVGQFYVKLPPINTGYAIVLLISLLGAIVASIWILQHRKIKELFQTKE